MKLEDFLVKVKSFFGELHAFLEKKKVAAEATGNKGRTGNIREATLNLLIPAAQVLSGFLDSWNLEQTSTILGQYSAVKDAVTELKEEDSTALQLLEKTGAIYGSSKYGIPPNIVRAIEAHTQQNHETSMLAAKLDELISLEPEVENLSTYPVAKVESVFDAKQLEARQSLIVQYQKSIQDMEARFKASETESTSTSPKNSSGGTELSLQAQKPM